MTRWRGTVHLVIALAATEALLVADAAAKSSSLFEGRTCGSSGGRAELLEGSIAAVDLESALFNVTIRKPDGTFDSVKLDVSRSQILEEGRLQNPSALEVGQNVTVCSTPTGGAVSEAQLIEIVPDDAPSSIDGSA